MQNYTFLELKKKTSKWANGRKYCKDLVFYVRMSNMI